MQTSQTKALRSREFYTDHIAFYYRYRGGGGGGGIKLFIGVQK